MKVAVLAICLALCCAVGSAKTQPEFQTAKVISQNIGSYDGGAAVVPMGGALIGVPIVRRSNIVELQTANSIITLAETGNGRGLLVLPVNGAVQFYQDKNWIVMLDAARKKHKFSIIHMETLDNNSQK